MKVSVQLPDGTEQKVTMIQAKPGTTTEIVVPVSQVLIDSYAANKSDGWSTFDVAFAIVGVIVVYYVISILSGLALFRMWR